MDLIKSVIQLRWVFLITGLLVAYSCRQDGAVHEEDLYGKWDVVKASRNGKETPYLRGGYFIIGADGTMTLNITGEDESGPYTFRKNTLRVSDKRDFIVESLRHDSLAIRYAMNENNQFLFYLTKKADETR